MRDALKACLLITKAEKKRKPKKEVLFSCFLILLKYPFLSLSLTHRLVLFWVILQEYATSLIVTPA